LAKEAIDNQVLERIQSKDFKSDQHSAASSHRSEE
jgi:hypothetical protein